MMYFITTRTFDKITKLGNHSLVEFNEKFHCDVHVVEGRRLRRLFLLVRPKYW